jgi:hypothetical protein
MRLGYKIVICLIAVLIVAIVLVSLSSGAGRLIQRVGAITTALISSLAALLAVTIALSNSDPHKRKVSIDIQPYITTETDNWRVLYKEEELTEEQKEFYSLCPKPITSYRVQYRMTNKSGSILKNPVVTFWLPLSKRAPAGQGDKMLGYRSNAFNSTIDLRILEMVDGVMISNSNLPYWPNGKDITMWFRMVLENGGRSPFPVEVSVNADNADGWSRTIAVEPETLLRPVENRFPVS